MSAGDILVDDTAACVDSIAEMLLLSIDEEGGKVAYERVVSGVILLSSEAS